MSKQPELPAEAVPLLEKIKEALAHAPMLSESQVDDVERFKREIVQYCQDGDGESADNAAKLCLALIQQGEAAKE